jgi:hypothetical protein
MAEAETNKICPKCGKQMYEGYIPDRIAHDSSGQVPIWISGQPEKRFFGGINLDGKDTIAVQTFRCQVCGFLESYAA